MNRFVLPAVALAAVALASGCTYSGGYAGYAGGYAQPMAMEHSPRAAAELAARLTGKVPGPPQSCLSTRSAGDMHIVDDYTILYRNRGTTYRNDPPGGCPGAGRPGSAMASRTFGTQLCRGDIVNIVDTASGFSSGSCVLGDFVPYRTATR